MGGFAIGSFLVRLSPCESAFVVIDGCGCGGWQSVSHPCHARCERRVGEELFAYCIIESLNVAGEKLASVESHAANGAVARRVHLCSHIVE